MTVQRQSTVSDNCLFQIAPDIREAAKGFLISQRVANRSPSYRVSLEITIALFATFAEDQGWSTIADVNASRIEEYLVYVQTRPRWFGDRDRSGKPLSD